MPSAMLEQTRKRGASALIYIVFGTLIAVFIINFGPQSQGSSTGCGGGGPAAAVTVGDHDVSRGSFELLRQAFFRGTRAQRARGAIDALVRREILAQEAEARGMRVTEELVDEAVKAGWIYAMLGRQSAKPEPGEKASAFFTRTGDEVFFNYKSFKNWLGQMNLTVGSYKAAQTREMLASMMAEQIRGGVRASRDEALSEFLFEGSTVTFDAVKF